MSAKLYNVANVDHEIFSLIDQEKNRQEQTLTLIASENYASQAVMQATGSCLTNKYAEGYPGKRYYAGCEVVDKVEQCAIDRCKKLFNAVHANVQPHAGSQANMAVYGALLQPGDTILGMNLLAGGHLTHGHKVNFSGKWFHAVQYGINQDTELLDYDEIEKLAVMHKPKLIIAGASAYSRIIDFTKFKEIADQVGAYFLADIAHIAGLIATGLHPSPIGIADVVTSTTHKTLRGPRGGLIMAAADHAETLDKMIIPGMQGGPLLQVIAGKAIAFKEAMEPSFKTYQQQVLLNAQAMAGAFTILGYRVVTGGTDNHLFTIDLRSKKITGAVAQDMLEKAGLVVNKNCIPNDPEKPWVTSGIRIGTPALTTRGIKETEVQIIAQLIDEVIKGRESSLVIDRVKHEVEALARKFPLCP